MKVKILKDEYGIIGKKKKIYALKGEILTVNRRRDDGVLIVKGKEIFSVRIDEVEIIED